MEFPRNLIAAVPWRINTILTDSGVHFTNRRRDRRYASAHEFERTCRENGMGHRLTKVNHPWTDGQLERINRTIRDATVKRFFHDSHEQFREPPGKFLDS